MLSLHPLPTMGGLRDTLAALLGGASLHLVDLKHDGPARVLALLRSGNIAVFACVPSVARALMGLDGAGMRSAACVSCGWAVT